MAAASQLKINKHFLLEKMEDTDIRRFRDFLASFGDLNLSEYQIHLELCHMNADALQSSLCLTNDQGIAFLTAVYKTVYELANSGNIKVAIICCIHKYTYM